MAFGLPYMGSKNIYAKRILDCLPAGKRFVDLFAGGCAVTDCAIRKYNNKYERYLINDINSEIINLYLKCLQGQNPVSKKWVSPDEFIKSDYPTKLVWSFNSNTIEYIYSKQNISQKQKMHSTDKSTKGCRLYAIENINRLNRLKLDDSSIIERIETTFEPYENYQYHDGDVVYCDIPYRNTDNRQYKTEFDYDKFWSWAKAQPFDIYVSERTIPDNAEIIMRIDVPNRASQFGTVKTKIEYLVKV